MSISTFRNIIEKPGCSIAVAVAMTVGIAGGLFYGYFAGDGGRGPANPGASGPAVASVGDYKVTADQVEMLANQQLEQLGQAMTALGPELQARFLAETLERQLDEGYLLELAKERKLDLSDASVMKSIEASFERQLSQERQRLEGTGKLAKGASDSQFVEALQKEQPNFDPAAEKAKQVDTAKQALADPVRRPQILAYVANQDVQAAFESEAKASETDLKAFFDIYKTKRILITAAASGSQTPEELGAKVVAEIKGGLSFEKAMDRYSKDQPEPKKALSETVTQVTGRMIAGDSAYEPVAKLAVGAVTDPIPQSGNIVIYKLIGKSSDLPKDFADKKATYESEYKRTVAQRELAKSLEAIKKAVPVKWDSAGFKALVDWKKIADGGFGLVGEAKAKRHAELQAVAEAAKAALTTDSVGQRAAIYAHFSANSVIWSESDPKEKEALRESRIEAVNLLLTITESAQLRLELVDLLAAKKDPGAGNELARVAEGNFDPTQPGQSVYSAVFAKMAQLQKAKLITPDQEKRIDVAQANWRVVKVEQDKAEAEAKRLQAEADKKAKEEAAKAKASEPPKPREKSDK